MLFHNLSSLFLFSHVFLSLTFNSVIFFFFLMIRRPPRSTLSSSSAASDVYKRQTQSTGKPNQNQCHDKTIANALSMRLAGMWIYPIKSCSAIAGATGTVAAGGALSMFQLLDRGLMFTDRNGRFLSQRKRHRRQGNGGRGFPIMSTICVGSQGGGGLSLSAPGANPHPTQPYP
eukprot:TRINITY_DN1757_c0_g1_i10.p1 TRINITY_DN1757_c0_g1~~TRINITY_DN1757_c0_g1_i10.p1  ORF type:complete len:174 (+),score=29.70 TRINITY_DN1757_c0_g1_i10:50-571(+)